MEHRYNLNRSGIMHSHTSRKYWSPTLSRGEMGLIETEEKRGLDSRKKGIPVSSRPAAELENNFFTSFGSQIDLTHEVFNLTGFAISQKYVEFSFPIEASTFSSSRLIIETIQKTRMIIVKYKDFSRYALWNYFSAIEFDEETQRPVLIRHFAVILQCDHAACLVSLSLSEYTAKTTSLRIKYGTPLMNLSTALHQKHKRALLSDSILFGKAFFWFRYAWSKLFIRNSCFRQHRQCILRIASPRADSENLENWESIYITRLHSRENVKMVHDFDDLCIPFLTADEFQLKMIVPVYIQFNYTTRFLSTIRWVIFIFQEDFPTARLLMRSLCLLVFAKTSIELMQTIFCKKENS